MAMWRSTDRILTTHGGNLPEVVRAKLAVMAEGAALASKRLWK